MPSVPLGIGSYSRSASFSPDVTLKNLYVERDESGASLDEHQRLQRPGCANYQTVATGSSVRGLFRMDGVLGGLPIVAIGTTVYKIDGTTATALGTILDDGKPVQMAGSGGRLGIVSGGSFYVSASNTLINVPMPTGTAIAIAGLNGYFTIGLSSGVFYFLVPGLFVIDPLSFETAESKSDGLIGIVTLAGDVYFFGSESVEVWQPTGDADTILAPSAGRSFDKGCIARDTIQLFDNTAFWCGNDGIIYRVSNVPERVSNVGIEERIRRRTSNALSALTFTIDGHPFYVLYIPGVGSFAYDIQTKNWSEFSSNGYTGWRVRNSCTLSGGMVLVGDSASGKLYSLDPTISTDDGVVFDRVVTGTVAFSGHRVRVNRFEVHVGCSMDTLIRLRWKDGNGAWSDYRILNAIAPTSMPACYRLGAARHPTRTFEVSCSSLARIRISGAIANEGRSN